MRDLFYYTQLALEAILGVVGIRAYEEPRHAVVDQLPRGVEVRHYESRLAAEVSMPGTEGRRGSDQAFKLLFAYIAGANSGMEGSEKIAMTVPVEDTSASRKIAMTIPVEAGSPGAGTRMRFFLPSRFTRENAPAPSDKRVHIVPIAPEDLAVLRFSGAPDPGAIAAQRKLLLEALAGSRWQPAGEPVVLFYDAPFTLPFARRNEVAVAVTEK